MTEGAINARITLVKSSEMERRTWVSRFRRHLGSRVDDLLATLGIQSHCSIDVTTATRLPLGVPHLIELQGCQCRVRRLVSADAPLYHEPFDAVAAAERAFADVFRNRELLTTETPLLSGAGGRWLIEHALRYGVEVDRLAAQWPAYESYVSNIEGNHYALEVLLSELAAPELPVRLAPDIHSAIEASSESGRTTGSEALQRWLADVRLDLFWDLGFWVPPFSIRKDVSLAPGEIVLQLNAMSTPVRRLPDNGGDVRARLGSAIVEGALSVAPSLLTLGRVEQMLRDLADPRFCDELVVDLLEEIDIVSFLSVVRELVGGRCSIKDQRSIMEALLSGRHSWPGVAGDAPSSIAALVQDARISLAPQITAQYARNGKGLSIFRLDGRIEAKLHCSGPNKLSYEEEAELVERLTMALRRGVIAGPPPVIVVDAAVRDRLRRLIELELPDLPVLAHQELLPDSVQVCLETIVL